ncbi:MAG: class I SAM-dependent methyltransferase [Terriglobia bacterium]
MHQPGIPSFLRLVPVDFEAGDRWRERQRKPAFDANRPAVVASTRVSIYVTKGADRRHTAPPRGILP